ncbi:unnamed protein product [Bursaphelenchus okinawaensis]|uniref:Meckel syndrome type 1 protein n=1 Tax=Bursaphelenchus okinawaensis TaxID=465554 RepID=A0A811LSE6_9BILA|nr:unnamed protein product [Bursaphelenchus okinawaensis]CAG9127685.1 unnamed protein product [Bursaphelenchus okinawaensis]
MRKNSANFYNFSGNPKSLELTVKLNYVGTSFGNLPSFQQFTKKVTDIHQRGVWKHGKQSTSTEYKPLDSNAEVVIVKWQQKIGNPMEELSSAYQQDVDIPQATDPTQKPTEEAAYQPENVQNDTTEDNKDDEEDNNEKQQQLDDDIEEQQDDKEYKEEQEEDQKPVTFTVDEEDTPPPSDPRLEDTKDTVDSGTVKEVKGFEKVEEDTVEKDTVEEGKSPRKEIWEHSQPSSSSTFTVRRRIFTITDSDLRRSKSTRRASSFQSNAEDSIAFRPRKVVPLSTDTLRRPVRDAPTNEQQKKQRKVELGTRTMYIMGYFGAWNEGYDKDNEKILCEIRLIGRKTIQIQPGLGEQTVETKIGTYSCTIEIPEELEFDKIPTISTYDDEGHEDEYKVDIPPNCTILLSYNIVIDKAWNMPHDGLYVEYNIDVPENMDVAQDEQLAGRTQICFSKAEGKQDLVYFSYPIQFSLLYRAYKPQTDQFFWPRIRLRCLAEDSWGRFYIDGYGTTSLPICPVSQQVLTISTWRPKNPFSHLARLREGFIGQAVDLAQPEFAGILESGQLPRISSKIGISAETSGTVQLTVSCLHQCRHYIPQDVVRTMHYEKMVEQIGLNSGLYWRIRKVLAQFEEAKKQLIRLRRRPMQGSAKFAS